MQLPQAFTERMRSLLGDAGLSEYLAAMDETRPRSLRVNTLKTTPSEFLSVAGAQLTPNGVIPEGYFIPEGFPVGTNPLHAAGLFYMQEPSAQLPAALLAPEPGETVLDLCAAPGGKTGQLAMYMKNEGLLIANEPVTNRAQVLNGTKERLGMTNTVVTSLSPDVLCPALYECCDRVLADAPCSGEGMFRKEPDAVRYWSPAHVTACADRQRLILGSAALAVRPGGKLCYSTCTFSPEEDEETVAFFLKAHPEFRLTEEHKLFPHTSTGEGQYAALFEKTDHTPCDELPRYKETRPAKPDKAALQLAEAFLGDTFRTRPQGELRVLPDGRVLLTDAPLPAALSGLRIVSAGVLVGELKKNRVEPAHALFMAYPSDMFRRSEEPDPELLLRFLRGEAIPCANDRKGYMPVTVSGHAVGFGKAANGTLKNHIPKGLRFR
ncbi:MAG: RsmB/NOP family class I SAM-dependent RNA methyltransferase [Clostridia bacterium]|nr:RsmB/NOP family class I SAM-dependent RNA methyltransferase [Clostridia bacterium]